MMKVTFSDWWCNSKNYWTNNQNVCITKNEQEFENKEGKKVNVVEKSVGMGKYPSLVRMQYIFNGIVEKTDEVKSIVYDEEIQLFLFEDYMCIGNRFDGVIYYYVDFSGIPVTDAWSNLTDTIYDKSIFWKYEENLRNGFSTNAPWFYGYNTKPLQAIISKELEEKNSLQRKRVIEKLERERK